MCLGSLSEKMRRPPSRCPSSYPGAELRLVSPRPLLLLTGGSTPKTRLTQKIADSETEPQGFSPTPQSEVSTWAVHTHSLQPLVAPRNKEPTLTGGSPEQGAQGVVFSVQNV